MDRYEAGHAVKGMFPGAPINFRLVSLLLIAVFLQHFAFATLQDSFGALHKYSTGIQTGYIEKGTIPQQDNQLDLFIEVESNDEDEVHNEQIHLDASIAKNYTLEGFHYSYFIHTLYLRLASSKRSKVKLPYFVLYHSWKSDLC